MEPHHQISVAKFIIGGEWLGVPACLAWNVCLNDPFKATTKLLARITLQVLVNHNRNCRCGTLLFETMQFWKVWHQSSRFCLRLITAPETIQTTTRVHEFLLTGIKRMTFWAYLNHDVFFYGGTCSKFIATTARNRNFFIFRMNPRLHSISPAWKPALWTIRCMRHRMPQLVWL